MIDINKAQALCKQISKRRRVGKSICGAKLADVQTVGEAASIFGLNAQDETYDEIGEERALAVLKTVLHKDLAYNGELMPEQEAMQFAREFIKQFDDSPMRLFTNGDFDIDPTRASWSAATDATFDTGVLVLTPHAVGCLWFMDED